jgi:hypothetical protein
VQKVTKKIKAICQPSFFAMLPKCNAHSTKNALHELAACYASPYTKSPSANALARSRAHWALAVPRIQSLRDFKARISEAERLEVLARQIKCCQNTNQILFRRLEKSTHVRA